MKIALIGPRMFPPISPGVSGIDTRAAFLLSKLSRDKTNLVYVLVRSWVKQKVNTENIHIITTPTIHNIYFDTPIYSFIASIVSIFLPVDIILYEGTSSTLFCFIPRLFGKKIITTIHSVEWQRKKWQGLGAVTLRLSERMAIFFSHSIVAVSREIQIYTDRQYNIHSFLISHFFQFKTKPLSQIIKQKYELNTEQYILFLGRFVPEKRVEWLIKAFIKINPSQKLILAGDISRPDNYTKKILQLDRKNNTIVFVGHVFGKEKEELLANCFLFVLPSELEGVSMSFLEALSYNRRALVADLPQHQAIIKQKTCLFKWNDYEDFYNKLKHLLSCKEKPPHVNKNELLSPHDFIKKYVELMSQIA